MTAEQKEQVLNEEKLADEMLEGVSGGSNQETISDGQVISNMLGINVNEINPGVISEKFAAGKVKVTFNGDNNANVYMYNGMRISRYEALIRLVRGNGHGTFDITPYLSDSHGDNKARNANG